MRTNARSGRSRARYGVAAVAVVGVSVAAVAVASAGHGAPATDCTALPSAVVAAPDRTARTATMVGDATYWHMEVPGLDAWAQRVATTPDGERAARFVAACPDALADAAAVAETVPPAARRAVDAARRYAREMWNERELTRLLPVVVRRGQVADAPAWSLVLAGPDAASWRYAVVGDDHRVVAWQLTGADTRRLFRPEAAE